MSNCPKCGTPISLGERFCPACGEPVQNINHFNTFNGTMPTIGREEIGEPIAINPLMPEIPDIVKSQEMPVVATTPEISDIPTIPEVSEPSIADILGGQDIPSMPEISEIPIIQEDSMMSDLPIDTLETPTLDMVSDIAIEPMKNSNHGSFQSKDSASSLKFNKVMLVAIVVVSILAILLMGFFMMRMFSNNNQPSTNFLESAKEYHYEGFNLYVPDGIYAEIYEGDFYVGDKDSWSAMMTLQSGVYNTLVSNKSQLIDYFEGMGYEVSLEPTEREISGTAFIKMEVVIGTKNVLVAYAKANGTKLFGIVLEKESGEYTDDDLKTIGTILSTMNFTGPNYQLPDGFQLDSFIGSFTLAE